MRKLVYFTVPFAIAAAACVYCLSVFWGLVAAAFAIAALAVVLRTKWRFRLKAAIALSGLSIGLLFCTGYAQFYLAPVMEADGHITELSATICDYPTDTDFGCKAITEITVNGRRVSTLMYLGKECSDLQPGDRVTLTAELARSDIDRDGDTRLYYQGKGIRLIAYARSEAVVLPAQSVPLRFWPVVFSEHLRQILAQAMPDKTAGLVQALLTGDKDGMSYAQRNDMSMAGVSHTVAISGMHVSILLAFIALLFGKRRILTAIIGIPVVIFFVLSTGCSPSAVRAAVMQGIFLFAPLVYRENDPLTSLCAALLLILLANPFAIANVSLQLSFAAMAGILLCTGPLFRHLASVKRIKAWLDQRNDIRPRSKRFPYWLRSRLVFFVLSSVATTLGAIVFSLPIVALSFGEISVYGVLSNLLILWAISLCFVGGIFVALLAWIWLPLGQILGWLLAWPVRYVFLITHQIAQLPFSTLSMTSPYPLFWMIGAYLLVAFGIVRQRAALPTLGILGSLALTMLLSSLDAGVQEFQITALDVGQGQCICMLTEDFSALYDCGGSSGDAAGQHAAEHLLNAGVRRLDALVLSHYDEDHVGGVEQLLYSIAVDTMYLPDTDAGDRYRETLEALAFDHGITVCYVTEKVQLDFYGGALQILPPVSVGGGNAASLSILFSAGDYDMLATGDMDLYLENLLLYETELPDVELFVAGHHGSRSSSGMALLSAIRPETVLISVGYNSYGHPTQEALSRFAAIGAEVYRTDLCGDITIER